MPSIRRSLLGYLLLLLVLALGGVGVLVYTFAKSAMRDREDAETRRIEHAYQAQEDKVLKQFDADLLGEAKSLSRVYEKEAERMLGWARPPQAPPVPRPAGRPEPRPEPRPIEPPIRPTDEEVGLFHLRTRLLQVGSGGPGGFAQPFVTWAESDARGLNPAWINYDTPRLRTRIVEAVRESFAADEHAAFCQFEFVITTPYLPGRTLAKANPSHIGQDLPFDAAEIDALKDRDSWTADVELPGKGKYRRVIVSNPRTFPAWVPGVPSQVVYNPPRPGGGRFNRLPDLMIRTYVQCAHPYSELDTRLAEDQRARDEQLASVRHETRDQLALLRTRLGLIGGGTFLALVVGGWLIVARGLFPMRRLSDAVSRVSERDFTLHIEPADLGRELAPIHARITQTLDQLRRAFAREKQAVADISHELRTPIASLQATLDVALRKPRTPDQYRATLEDCRAICKQLGQLVERIMVLASLDAGTARTARTRSDAADIAAGCAAVIRPLAASHGLQFASRVAAPLELDTDPDKLREVLVNLLHNAVEYNQPGGRIDLTGRRENGSVVLEVRDTGIGMAPDVRDRIFERFFRADASRQATGVHAGLGLAIVKEYVERLGGRIAVESEPGAGSTFRLTLPAAADIPAEPEFPAERGRRGRPVRFLNGLRPAPRGTTSLTRPPTPREEGAGMRSTSLFAAGVAAAVAAVVGCSPGKELPAKQVVSTEPRPSVQPAAKLPTLSDPAAKELVTKAIAAHTKNDPAKLSKLKAVQVSLSGQWNTGAWISVNRIMLAEWPDRYRCTLTSDLPTFRTTTLGYNGSTGHRRAGEDAAVALSQGDIQALRWDTTAQLWVPLLVPLADPAAVVFGASDELVDGKAVKVVKASLAGHPVWTLGFDPGSLLLVRIAYDGLEAGLPVQKVVLLSEHVEKHGLMVPGKWEMFHAGNPIEISRLLEITFPDKIEPAEFQGQ